ncbi:MAG: hypothetical protein AB7I18_01315 [Candidatus Berkiella sp.]
MILFFKSWLNRYRLLSHYEENRGTVVVFKNKLGRVFKVKLNKIARNSAFIRHFSKQDAHLLGYLLGCEDTLATLDL